MSKRRSSVPVLANPTAERFDALHRSLEQIWSAGRLRPEGLPWFSRLGHLVVDLTALGCRVDVTITVDPDAAMIQPLPPP
jgi:hypothetical protein